MITSTGDCLGLSLFKQDEPLDAIAAPKTRGASDGTGNEEGRARFPVLREAKLA